MRKTEKTIEADKLVNVNLRYREQLLYEQSNILASLVQKLKDRKVE
jgi:hypothetical protein